MSNNQVTLLTRGTDRSSMPRQVRRGSRETVESQLAYWKQQLAGAAAGLELPADHQRPATRSGRGAVQARTLPAKLTAAVKELSRAKGVALRVTLIAAFQALLYRYTRQEDIVFGLEVGEGELEESADSVRCLGNTLAVRTDLSSDPAFDEFLRRVDGVVDDAESHQAVSLERLLEELQPEPDPSRTPLFQVTFQLRDSSMHGLDPDSGISRFDLTLCVVDRGEHLDCLFQYSTDLFEAATIARMLGHFETLLEGAVSAPQRRLSELPMLTGPERRQLLVDWNTTGMDYPREACIHQLFEAQAATTPDDVAVIFEHDKLTYRELNQRANQLARHLRHLGVGPDVLVGICMERSAEIVVALLGILKAGGAYVPLDPRYPKERLHLILEDARATVLLTQQSLVNDLPTYDAKVVCLDAEWTEIDRGETANLVTETTSRNLAYVIYTSGSTGKPKGVAIEHRCTVNFIHWATAVFSKAELAGVLASTSLCFDLSVFELFVPLSCGGKVILAQNALELPTLPARHEVTLVNTVPSAIRELVRLQGLPPSAHTVNLAGEPLPTSLVRELYQVPTIRHVYDLYGPTETTTYSTFTRRSGDAPATIGRPLANTQIYILDPSMEPVPVGVAGELYIGGDGVARGYLDKPDLTATRFLSNVFVEDKESRLYRTGDLARYRSDGNIEFLGRMDHQVKIRGFRIELGEVESQLRTCPGVGEAVVVAREDNPGDKRLVAYLVASQGQSLAADKLREFLKERLPEYMVPAAFVVLAVLPLTPNGKVDRRALPVPDSSPAERSRTVTEPRDPLEFQLTNLWEKLLGTRPIGIRDRFFDLGGHSLLAARLFAEINHFFGKNLPLATLLQAPTVEQLAAVLRHDGWTPPWSSLVPIQSSGQRPPLYFIHANGGNILSFIGLVRHLSSDQPVYGLQAVGLDGRQAPLVRVEDMAEHYLAEIRRVQPRGPYSLCGLSFGGVIAFEMAQRLHLQGEEVAFLGLLDTTCPGYRIPMRDRLTVHLTQLRQLGLRGKFGYVKQAIQREFERRTYKSYLDNDQVLPSVLHDISSISFQAERKYVPRVYPGRITFFRATERLAGDQDPELSWGKLTTGGLEVHDVPGHHANFHEEEPNVGILAKKLTACLDVVAATYKPAPGDRSLSQSLG